MPKAAKHSLNWSAEHGGYELHEQGCQPRVLTDRDTATWVGWLEEHQSIAFAGRAGRVNLLKEARKGGAHYWYAYRRHGQRISKRYLGRSADATFAQLEAVAAALAESSAPVEPAPIALFVPQMLAALPTPLDARSASVPLLAPKLQLPRLPADLVTRARLFAQLDAGLNRKLTLVTAPAGFGKTTLVRQWLSQGSGVRGQGSGVRGQRLGIRSATYWPLTSVLLGFRSTLATMIRCAFGAM